ncbi:hydroxyacid dehydrogenase [Streptomyces sp. NPDC050610]|uniref:hydroxyacid dehydrogenase n=1 Tax=Streptomyces sp. NPDC050610 TaxID=3157097 RepID=UPI00342D7D83
MPERPTAAMAMGADEAEAVLPPELRARLARLTDLHPDPLTGPLDTPAARTVLARTDLLVTGWGCPPLTADVLAHAPRLRAVLHAAGSVKALVSEALWARGIAVSSAADANAGPVADFTLAAIVLAAKKALPTAAAYPGGWPAFRDRRGADARTIGVIGASRIGRLVIARLRDSDRGHRLLLHDPYVREDDAARLGTEPTGLDELCRTAGIVTVHAPELPDTIGMLNARRLALIPDGGTVVNTARGSLIDTDALTRECATGRLDAFLDVTDPEPLPAGHPLLALPNVLVTPHIAGAQGSEARRLGAYAVDEVARHLRGEPLLGRRSAADLPYLA